MAFNVQAPSELAASSYVRPSTTGATALVTAAADRAFVHALRFVNDTGTLRTVTVTHYRAAEDDSLPLFGAALDVAANSEVDKALPGLMLNDGDQIRVTVSAADSVRCWAFTTQRGG